MNLKPIIRMVEREQGGRRLPKPRAQDVPWTQEREYQREIRKTVELLTRATKDLMIVRLPTLAGVAQRELPIAARRDALEDEVDQIIKSINVVYERDYSAAELRKIALARGESVSNFNRRAVKDQFKRVLGLDVFLAEPWLRARMGSFAIANAGLIESIEERFLRELSNIVSVGFGQGSRWETIAEDISARFEVAESRADLIARDQVQKLNGQLTMLRQTELGVKKYEWSTSGDERVRDSHRRNEGKVFSWDKPPRETGHPGEDIQCRCVALPVLESVVEDD